MIRLGNSASESLMKKNIGKPAVVESRTVIDTRDRATV